MNKIKVRVIAFVLALTCFLTVGCGNKETSVNETSLKENTTYKITWSEKGEDHELEFLSNGYENYVTYGGNKLIFYFEDGSKFKTIIVQNGICTITTKNKAVTIISGNFVIEPVK